MTLLRIFAAVFTLASLAACAEMPMQVSVPVPQMRPVPPAPPAPNAVPGFIADQRADARRLDAAGNFPEARLHWRYVAALLPNDMEAKAEIARLDGAIRAKVAALLAQGEADVARNRVPDAQAAFLKVLAIDGANERARTRLRELDTRAAFIAQDRKDQRARATARNAGSEGPADDR
jgi:hypothetical protein